MAQHATYLVAGQPFVVETRDGWSTERLDRLLGSAYLTVDRSANGNRSTPDLIMRSAVDPPTIPAAFEHFEIVGGLCHTDGNASYLAIDGSLVTIIPGGATPVEVWTGPAPDSEPAAMIRIVSCGLSMALRRRGLFEMHSAALVDPWSGDGLLLIGPSGSGKSTLSVHLAAARWGFLTDDVLLLTTEPRGVTAWPLRRSFAITSDTYKASEYLHGRVALSALVACEKHQFLPQEVFEGTFHDHCVPRTLLFCELTGASSSDVSPLSAADTMARLIRNSPWSCYERSTAEEHLSVLSALATNTRGFALRAGNDLLDADRAVALVARCARSN